MIKGLDNLALTFSFIGVLSVILTILQFISFNPFWSYSPLGTYIQLAGYAGLVLGIISLANGSAQKWKAIVAILVSGLTMLITILISIVAALFNYY